MLQTITELSHEFGKDDYVLGGGGNASAKDAGTLWIKPSGTTLGGMDAESFLAMDRRELARLYDAEAPDDPTAREAMVKRMMLAAVCPPQQGRPSVEAPLHDSFKAAFVVHTHPALVNGMTCAMDGEQACGRLFPEATWVDFTDPGYVLSMRVRGEIEARRTRLGREPRVVFLGNHGIFIADDKPDEIRRAYAEVLASLAEQYRQAGVSTALPTGPPPGSETVESMTSRLRDVLGEEAAFVCSCGPFAVAPGPISPDHIVYSKSFPLIGEPSAEAVADFRRKHGYNPRVIACDEGVFGVGATEAKADLALGFARDGALVMQLAEAFGGIRFMNDRQRQFIENWEVEAYRAKQT